MQIEYRLSFPDARSWTFTVRLDAAARMVRESGTENPLPAWTELERGKCPHCTLDARQERSCPAAASIVPLVRAFGASLSYEQVDAEVVTESRSVRSHVSLQEALASLMGLCMAASGCPTMDFFRPMARYHLPFATEDETQYRVLSAYLLGQFLAWRREDEPDWSIGGLYRLYDEVRVVNRHMAKRLSEAAANDANANALVNLDCLATSISFLLRQDRLDELETLFSACHKRNNLAANRTDAPDAGRPL